MPEILYFPYYGPNRHSDKRLVECRLDFNVDQPGEFPRQQSDIKTVLIRNGMLDSNQRFPHKQLGENRIDWYSSLFVQTALLLQRTNGHQVSFFSVSSDPLKKRSIALLEHEDSETALAAVRMAVEVFSGKPVVLLPAYRQFSEFARSRVLSAETAAIIRAARRQNIPYFQLERAPLTGSISTGSRIRRNGLLGLGYGVNSRILDGTFCVSTADDFVKSLLRNPGQRAALLKHLGIPMLQGKLLAKKEQLLRLLVINRRILAFRQFPNGRVKVVKTIHESLAQQMIAISEKVGFAPILATCQVSDPARALTPPDGFADFELAPNLNGLFTADPSGKKLLESAADDLIKWLYPEPAKSRIPVVAVTGTNGKTTTSRMLHHIFRQSGFKTGLVCTDGIFLDEKQVSDVDNSTFLGHARVLINKQVNAAVLETHHRGIAVHGFPYHRCDVAMCLNVTEEHIAKGEIETIEEMTGIKRALVERAAKVAILFADDRNCAGMIGHMQSEYVCLVSLHSNVGSLRTLAGDRPAGYCVLEPLEQRDWIVLYHSQERIPVMPVDEIPATFNGTAGFNVSNAMHAIAAAYYSGIDISSVRSALSIFSAGQQYTPGRMNVFEGLPFRVIMDFAHTPDGLKQLSRFADLQQVDGRKIIAFAGLAKRPDEINRKIAKAVSGHFDFYFCKDYEPSEGPKLRLVAPLMQNVLIKEGVPREATKILTYGKDVIYEILDSCQPGDLLFLMAGHAESGKIPEYIETYKAERLDRRLVEK